MGVALIVTIYYTDDDTGFTTKNWTIENPGKLKLGSNSFTIKCRDTSCTLNIEGETEREQSNEDVSESPGIPKGEILIETNGKTIYKVYSTGVIVFSGEYKGTGNFIIKILDSNQDIQKLVCNEIGDYVLEGKTVSVGEGVRYIQVESNHGSWNLEWTGTGGK